jgi:folate-binding protein YgfZ
VKTAKAQWEFEPGGDGALRRPRRVLAAQRGAWFARDTRFVPPAAARAGTSQRDVPTCLPFLPAPIRDRSYNDGMHPLALHEFHDQLNARFAELNGAEVVADYTDTLAEHAALRASAGIFDMSFRSRLCLTGADRVRFLHGQVTNDVKRLNAGEGCYAALVTAKGKMLSDFNILCLADELLLDFEPGLTETVSQRLEKHLVADHVQVVNVASAYGLLSVQGPKADAAVRGLGVFPEIPAKVCAFAKFVDPTLGELYLVNQPRLGSKGFDLFAPTASLGAIADKWIAAVKSVGGRACGWQAFDLARIEAGIPRFGVDMDETNIPLECGIEDRTISYSKGCYIGQEVINRIHSVGHVTKELRGLQLTNDLKQLPVKGDKLIHDHKEVGYVTSAARSVALQANLALGYVRREANQPGTELTLHTAGGDSLAKVVGLPFGK